MYYVAYTLLISALSDIAFFKKTLRKIPENRENYDHEKSWNLTFKKTEKLATLLYSAIALDQ